MDVGRGGTTLDRATNITKLVSAGFPRSGNTFLNQILKKSFPKVNVVEFTHNVNTLDFFNCIVPIRNPYHAVPSWGAFSGEQNLESTAKWYIRFNTKVLEKINDLLVIDFIQLSNNPSIVVKKISNNFNISYTEIDYLKIDKNAKFKNYKDYDSILMKECYQLYKGIIDKL